MGSIVVHGSHTVPFPSETSQAAFGDFPCRHRACASNVRGELAEVTSRVFISLKCPLLTTDVSVLLTRVPLGDPSPPALSLLLTSSCTFSHGPSERLFVETASSRMKSAPGDLRLDLGMCVFPVSPPLTFNYTVCPASQTINSHLAATTRQLMEGLLQA